MKRCRNLGHSCRNPSLNLVREHSEPVTEELHFKLRGSLQIHILKSENQCETVVTSLYVSALRRRPRGAAMQSAELSEQDADARAAALAAAAAAAAADKENVPPPAAPRRAARGGCAFRDPLSAYAKEYGGAAPAEVAPADAAPADAPPVDAPPADPAPADAPRTPAKRPVSAPAPRSPLEDITAEVAGGLAARRAARAAARERAASRGRAASERLAARPPLRVSMR